MNDSWSIGEPHEWPEVDENLFMRSTVDSAAAISASDDTHFFHHGSKRVPVMVTDILDASWL